MPYALGGYATGNRTMREEAYISQDDTLILGRESDEEAPDSVTGICTEEAQTLTVFSSSCTEKAAEKEKISMDASSTTLHGHYAVLAAKASSFSVTTTSTIAPTARAHFLSYPKDQPLIPIRILARQAVLGALHVHVRLWRISTRLNRSDDIPDQFYQDLIELQRQNAYPSFVATRAWNMLVRQITSSRTRAIVENLMLFPESVVIDVLRKLAKLDDMATPWSTFTHYQPRFCLVFRHLLENNRGRTVIHSSLSMATMVTLLTERHTSGPTDSYLPLYRFFDALLASTLPAVPEVFSTIDRCDLPPPAECFVQYLLTTRNSKTMLFNLHKLVDVIMSFIRPFADNNPAENYITSIYNTYPALRTTHCDDRGVTLHPTLPFFQLAFRIAFHLPQAADLFINAGILNTIRKLWLQGFPDIAEPFSETKVLIHWPEAHRRNCMIITSLFVLGSLARHHPSVREFANHMLRLAKISAGNILKLHWDVAMIEARVWNMRLTEFFPRGRVAKEVHPANSLPLFSWKYV
ncbi:hypothetical protein QCA50_014518 [Cerrena zonata]|uniref:Uncharacterized protein n=1 Tax=Cerrena zonata TaxID=2478898 RepID=A0AAW0FVL8_9APHY